MTNLRRRTGRRLWLLAAPLGMVAGALVGHMVAGPRGAAVGVLAAWVSWYLALFLMARRRRVPSAPWWEVQDPETERRKAVWGAAGMVLMAPAVSAAGFLIGGWPHAVLGGGFALGNGINFWCVTWWMRRRARRDGQMEGLG